MESPQYKFENSYDSGIDTKASDEGRDRQDEIVRKKKRMIKRESKKSK